MVLTDGLHLKCCSNTLWCKRECLDQHHVIPRTPSDGLYQKQQCYLCHWHLLQVNIAVTKQLYLHFMRLESKSSKHWICIGLSTMGINKSSLIYQEVMMSATCIFSAENARLVLNLEIFSSCRIVPGLLLYVQLTISPSL